MTVFKTAALTSLLMLFTAAADAETAAPVLAKDLAPARAGTRLRITSDAFQQGDAMAERYGQDGDNFSPPVSWSKGPTGTMSYAVIVEDGMANQSEPATYWIVYDIPGTMSRIAEHQPAEMQLDNGAAQPLNAAHKPGYNGPKASAGEVHPIHVEVFALNTRLRVDPGEADRDDVVKAMKGHVLASGDLVVTYSVK